MGTDNSERIKKAALAKLEEGGQFTEAQRQSIAEAISAAIAEYTLLLRESAKRAREKPPGGVSFQ